MWWVFRFNLFDSCSRFYVATIATLVKYGIHVNMVASAYPQIADPFASVVTPTTRVNIVKKVRRLITLLKLFKSIHSILNEQKKVTKKKGEE